uniref:Vacuolar protein sorting-associated protein 13D n=1 Tax=Magallana gigas TaxID=29159 RepID=K1QTM2_MAGGI|eukprot:XP_011416250.2 PREDICTED: tripartite motif-containing protein 40 [Crassostrea gigas]
MPDSSNIILRVPHKDLFQCLVVENNGRYYLEVIRVQTPGSDPQRVPQIRCDKLAVAERVSQQITYARNLYEEQQHTLTTAETEDSTYMHFSTYTSIKHPSRCLTIDRRTWAQDVLRCHLCETPSPPMYCDICHIHLCKACVGEHLSDESKDHRVVPFKKRGFAPECLKHSPKLCELYCEHCNIHICLECVSSGEHLGHKQVELLKSLEAKKEMLQTDLQELETSIFSKYQEIAINIPVQKAELYKNSKKLTAAIEKHGNILHREIDAAINKQKSDVDEMESKHLDAIKKQENEIKHTLSEITQRIVDLEKLLKFSLPINPEMLNLAECHLNSQFHYQDSLLRKLTKNRFMSRLDL